MVFWECGNTACPMYFDEDVECQQLPANCPFRDEEGVLHFFTETEQLIGVVKEAEEDSE